MRDEIKRFWAALRQAQAARENPASAPCFAMTGEGRSAWLAAHYAGRPNTGGKPRELIEQSRDERDAAWLLQDQVDAAAAGHDDVTEVRPAIPEARPAGEEMDRP